MGILVFLGVGGDPAPKAASDTDGTKALVGPEAILDTPSGFSHFGPEILDLFRGAAVVQGLEAPALGAFDAGLDGGLEIAEEFAAFDCR